MTLETAKSVREDFLHQNAFDEIDTYTSLAKQRRMLGLILEFHHRAGEALANGASLDRLLALEVRDEIARAKSIPEGQPEGFDAIAGRIRDQVAAASAG